MYTVRIKIAPEIYGDSFVWIVNTEWGLSTSPGRDIPDHVKGWRKATTAKNFAKRGKFHALHEPVLSWDIVQIKRKYKKIPDGWSYA